MTKLKARYVIGHEDGQHVIYENGEIVYDGDTVVFVGCAGTYPDTVDTVKDEGNAIISPGFIDLDALGDIDHALIVSEVGSHMEDYLSWHEDYLPNRTENMTAEEEAFKSLYAYTQLIMHGITTAMPISCVHYKHDGETYEELEAAAHHAGKLGLRVYLGPSYISKMNVINKNGQRVIKELGNDGVEGLERAKAFAKAFDGAYNELIKAVMVPERIELQTEEVLIETKRFAKERDIPVRLHAAQGAFEYKTIMEKYNVSPIKYLQSIGFLDDRTIIPHAIYASGYSGIKDASEDDLEILQAANTSIIHCPLVYARDGVILESFGRYKRKGINISIGTDTFPPDIFQNIRIGSATALHKDECRKENYFREYFNAATIGGANALKRNDLGRLQKGARADFIVIDLSGFHMGTIDDPIRTVCMCATARDIRKSVINGRTVMDNRIIQDADYDMLTRKAQEYYDKLKRSYLIRNLNKVSFDELFKPSYKIIKE